MKNIMPFSVSLTVLLTLTVLLGGAQGQCPQGKVDIFTMSDRVCAASTSHHVTCSSPEQPIRFYRDGEEIFNGTTLDADLQPRANVTISAIPVCDNVTVVTISVTNLAIEDSGNYMCRSASFESDVRRVTVVPSSPVCDITLEPGPIVQATQNATFLCSSRTGSPQWNVVATNPQTVVTSLNESLSSLTVQASLNTTTPSFMCTVTSTCHITQRESTTLFSSCRRRIRVVENPVGSYLSLTRSLLTIRVGQSATYYCQTYLSGTTVSLVPLDPSLSHANHSTVSDSTDEITFFNLTMNHTDPIVECRLLYNGVTVTSALGRIVVLPEVEDVPTTPSTLTNQPSTRNVIATTSDEMSTTSATTSNNSDSLTTKATTNVSTTLSGGSTFAFNVDLRLLAGGLVAGLIVFILIIVGIALVFRWRATKKDEWNVDTISSRRGRGEVASDGETAGRLEWETDTNPLVELDASTSFSNDHQDQAVGGEYEYIEPIPNGHVATHDKAHLISVDVVIENGTSTSGPVGVSNEGFAHDESPIAISHAYENVPRGKYDTTSHLPDQDSGGAIANEHNDDQNEGRIDTPDEPGFDDESIVTDFSQEVLNFIDATKFDGRQSYRDADSGFGLSPESVLSEIEDGAINIVAV